jgi:Asp-tRNA(Asn)/Glu-tRNA(Gln) amidotransferase A subunit family amidase
MEPYWLSATEAIRQIQSGELTSTELIKSCIRRINALEENTKAWEYFEEEAPMAVAQRIDELRLRGESVGALQGVPIGVKDIFNTEEGTTQMGSPYWKGFTAGNDARVVAALKRKGGILMGKTVTAEFAVHHPGPTVNPHNHSRSPGTSSSGSAAAVAVGMVPLALGTQTAGSTIRPASYCGVYGYKPSFGVVPRTGILKTIDTLDHVTFFARSVADIRLIFDLARVGGKNHPFVYEHLDQCQDGNSPPQWRVAFVRGPKWHLAEDYAKAAIQGFSDLLRRENDIQVDEFELPPIYNRVHENHHKIYSKMLFYYFQEEVGDRPDIISDVFKEMVEKGRQFSKQDYFNGLAFQREFQAQVHRDLSGYDIILNLSTSGEAMVGLDTPDKPDNCLVWTFAHVPALSVPAFKSPSGLPFGAQLVAGKYADYKLLNFAQLLFDRKIINQAPYPTLPV